MGKKRVYELARELGIESKVLVGRIKGLGIEINSHQSTLNSAQIAKIKEGLTTPKAVKAAAPGDSLASVVKKRPSTVIRRRKRAEPAEQPEEEAAEHTAQAETASEAAHQEEQATEQQTSAPTPQKVAPAEEVQAEETSTNDEDRAPEKPKSTGGAKILRRATAEEVAATVSKRQEKTGGYRSSKPTYPRTQPSLTPPVLDPLDIPLEEPGRGNRAKDKRRIEADAEETRRKAALVRAKRDQINTRTLLSRVEDDIEPIPAGKKRKTVYTPSASGRKRDLKRRKDLKKTEITTPRAAYRVVKMSSEITVGELARQMSVKAGDIIKKLMDQGLMVRINDPIDEDTATLIASEYGFDTQVHVRSLEDILQREPGKGEAKERPPIVTIMGHVDHGKTSILDAIRQSKVAQGEAGGITQHIGAYSVDHEGRTISFLDTPGHEAFSSMRARGAKVTDIVVLVVAADDGVMPQTIEAISHAKEANVPIVVAVNKIDKPNINIERVLTELTEYGIQSEEWGGDTQFVKVSALEGTGLSDLLEAILLQAEVLELKADPTCDARGVVVEAHLDKGRGPVATVMVQEGTLKKGDYLVAGKVFGKVRTMTNHLGTTQIEAGPSSPVEVIGLSEVPEAGDMVFKVAGEKVAREATDYLKEQAAKSMGTKSSAATIDELLGKVRDEQVPDLPIIIKGDTQGSVEAIAESISKIDTDKVRPKFIHKAVGGINESDLSLAQAANALIIAFNVRAKRGLDDTAEELGVPIQYFSVIYDVVDAVKAYMKGKLPPVLKEKVVGHAEVRTPISVPKIGLVAGSAVTDGKILRGANLRLIRDDVVIYDGKVSSLRRFKEDVKEVASGYECGISIEGYNDVKIGDVIEAYIVEEMSPTL